MTISDIQDRLNRFVIWLWCAVTGMTGWDKKED